MTMNVPTGHNGAQKLNYPRIILLVSEPIASTDPPVSWIVGSPHPFVTAMKIVAIFQVEDFLEIYSMATDENGAKHGMRDLVPDRHVRLIREGMPFHVFDRELGAAELAEIQGDDDEDEEDDEDPPPQDQQTGQTATS